MTKVQIEYNYELRKAIYLKYFKYEWKLQIKKPILLILPIVSILIAVIGLITGVKFFLFIGLIMFSIVTAFLAYFYLSYKLLIVKFVRSFDIDLIETEKELFFSFDNDSIVLETKNTCKKFNWSLITKYVENDGDLYLYVSKKNVYEIISESLIGADLYVEFKIFLIRKFNSDNNG